MIFQTASTMPKHHNRHYFFYHIRKLIKKDLLLPALKAKGSLKGAPMHPTTKIENRKKLNF